MDQYIAKHKLPCRKHGRQVCGVCSFRKECTLNNCKCELFIPKGKKIIGICDNCEHPFNLHKLYPLQTKEVEDKGKKDVNILKILNIARDPDVSIPVSVVGVSPEKIIIPPKSYSEVRLEIMKEQSISEKMSITTKN